MIRAARLAALVLLVGVAAPSFAQMQADPVRLDDFAVARTADDPSRVDQLTAGREKPAGSPRPHDRAVVADENASQPAIPLPQLSEKGQSPAQAQLSKTGAAPDETQAAVSSTADSRPQGVTRLGGQDRCDPQLAKEELARCRRILELRAHEFNAPAPPKLSAEQQLLAAQQDDERQPGPTLETRLRLASREEPDAELQSNQELAALYLRSQQTPTEPTAPEKDEEKTAADASLAQILNALQGQAGSPPPGQ